MFLSYTKKSMTKNPIPISFMFPSGPDMVARILFSVVLSKLDQEDEVVDMGYSSPLLGRFGFLC